ncbi:hypothetical protein BS47DRAFT_1363375 [Hydnum rufescens UP504]|uniref:Uncharacterized protein n=1 Tax=Hydnum rufescens UP504 TaxID=1448309 RepID=A0A9P6DVV6_9AGAM|nr:hypothetical protein BS47DRAFT_1363375 [Hydnum rufescens UP504]
MSITHLVGGSFFGNLLSALSISSKLRVGRDTADLVAFLWIGCGGLPLSDNITQSLYWWTVTNHNNPLALKRLTWEFTIFQITAQVLVLVQFGFGAATGVIAYTIRDIGVLLKKYRWVAMSWPAIQAIADIVIATCMCLVLRHRHTGFQKTDSVINLMVLKYGFNFSVAICMPLGGLYSVTMLANLHMRKTLRARLDTPSLLEMISSSMKKGIWRKAGDPENAEKLQAARINIAREVANDDVHIIQMNSDTSVRFTWVQSAVSGAT